jgi:hypothetical protein
MATDRVRQKSPAGSAQMAACKGCGSADPPNYPVPGDILILKMKIVVKNVAQCGVFRSCGGRTVRGPTAGL